MAILGNFETSIKQKQSGYLSTIKTTMIQKQQQQTNQWVLTSVQFNLVDEVKETSEALNDSLADNGEVYSKDSKENPKDIESRILLCQVLWETIN